MKEPTDAFQRLRKSKSLGLTLLFPDALLALLALLVFYLLY
jgi:hypothetical protein